MPKIAIKTPPPEQFQRAAMQAQAIGGALRMNGKGEPIAQGATWRGKAAIWAKQRFMPGLERRQNAKVLHAFQKSVDSAYSVSSEGVLKEMCSAKLPGQVVAGDIREAADAYKETAQLATTSVRQTNDYFGKVSAQEKGFEDLSRLAGKNSDQMKTEGDFLKLQYGRFVRQLAKNPLLKEGTMPHEGTQMMGFIGKKAQPYRLEDGQFTEGFLKAALIVTMENMDGVEKESPPEAVIEDYGVEGALAEEDLEWLRGEYQNALPSSDSQTSSDSQNEARAQEALSSSAQKQAGEVPTGTLIDFGN